MEKFSSSIQMLYMYHINNMQLEYNVAIPTNCFEECMHRIMIIFIKSIGIIEDDLCKKL